MQVSSLPSRERGLKLHPAAPQERILQLSLPSRERGLKSAFCASITSRNPSLPSRERGLKSHKKHLHMIQGDVAPFAGAWIEIGRVH